MSTVSKKDSSELEDIYAKIYESKPEDDKNLTEESNEEEDEGAEVDASIELTNKSADMKKSGKKVPPKLAAIFAKADRKLDSVANKLSSD